MRSVTRTDILDYATRYAHFHEPVVPTTQNVVGVLQPNTHGKKRLGWHFGSLGPVLAPVRLMAFVENVRFRHGSFGDIKRAGPDTEVKGRHENERQQHVQDVDTENSCQIGVEDLLIRREPVLALYIHRSWHHPV